MANGSAVRLVSEPSITPVQQSEPEIAPAKPAIEVAIGEAAVDACTALSAAMLEFHSKGWMTHATKSAGAEKIAKLAQLELDTLGEINNFADIARREGKLRLRKILDTDPDFRLHQRT